MKITICSSLFFSEAILKAKQILEEFGHECLIPYSTEFFPDNPEFNNDFKFCIKNDVQMDHFRKIENSDAILVINNCKNKINGYIGGAVLTEMAIARYLGKKIFVLNNLPSTEEIRHIFEVTLMQPIILEGDLTKIE
jgi:hypothetical protein